MPTTLPHSGQHYHLRSSPQLFDPAKAALRVASFTRVSERQGNNRTFVTWLRRRGCTLTEVDDRRLLAGTEGLMGDRVGGE